MSENIIIKGARTHNLKNINLEIPKNSLVVITGVSGSGKSSLAFDTIFAEGQRRYVESLSAYARQFLGNMDKPDVDEIKGLSPAISIEQKTASRSPRSTVGTTTEIYDYFRLLFAKVGIPHCPECNEKVQKTTPSNIVTQIGKLPLKTKIMIMAPIIRGKKGQHIKVFENIKRDGFLRYRVDGEIYTMAQDFPELDANKTHTVEVVIDRIVIKDFGQHFKELSTGEKIEIPNPNRARVADSVELSLKKAEGLVSIANLDDGTTTTYSENFVCSTHGSVIPEIEPRSFSFNSPYGACDSCHGLGRRQEVLAKLLLKENLSLEEGAIIPWNAGNTLSWYLKLLEEVGKEYGFDTKTPIEKFTKEQREILIYGAGNTEFAIKMSGSQGKSAGEEEGFVKYEGIISNLERRYLETDSDHVRKALEKFMEEQQCSTCNGGRLKKEFLGVTILGKNILDATQFSIKQAADFFADLKSGLDKSALTIATPIIDEISERLKFLLKVGLAYLTLDRSSATLSGGEAQRIRLATQIGSKLEGVLYVLDEPSIGLHQRDNEKLIETMRELQELGNTVLVVEHDEETMKAADYLIEIGPKAGKAGGEVINIGTPEEFLRNKTSSTAAYLSGRKKIEMPTVRRTAKIDEKTNKPQFVSIKNATFNNLKNVSVDIPLGCFVGVSGVSGSGKSSLINGILAPHLLNELNKAKQVVGEHKKILGVEYLDKAIIIDQSAIGKSPRSNPATYVNVFNDIRTVFSEATESKIRGYKIGRFSFNVKGGRCEECQGDGIKKIEMHFLPDVYVECEVCHGKRYNTETLEVTWRGKNIADVLEMTIAEASQFFEKTPAIHRKLTTLESVGLGYLQLGQSATTLSGGEAQRIKLSTELSKRSTGKTFYILDEPTTGLHFEDIQKLLDVLERLVESGNTVLVIEHSLDVLKCCDYLIDIGPEGGSGGGEVIAEGTPEKVAKSKKSHTAKFLKELL
ncbi:TPA: excinuclease ABC subunit UvrA [Candidatus Gracilibacteria bacterium]|nr:excinuclease ABC subunit UvrA [Candidatus Gracilibacteria bacterium]